MYGTVIVWWCWCDVRKRRRAALLPSHLYSRLPRPVITPVNPRLVISSTGDSIIRAVQFYSSNISPYRAERLMGLSSFFTPIIESDGELMFKSRNRKQGRRDARIALNLSLTSQIGMNISLTTEPCNGANCATFFCLIQIWAWFSLEILPRFRRRFSSWVVSYGRVPFFVPIHSNPVFFSLLFSLWSSFLNTYTHTHLPRG